MAATADYPALRAWHHDSGSFAYYIEGRLEKARATGAPLDAIYWWTEPGTPDNGEGVWKTVRDLPDNHPFRERFAAEAKVAAEREAGIDNRSHRS